LNFNPYRNDTIKIDTLLNRHFNLNHTSNTDDGTYTIFDLQNNVLATGNVDEASNFSMRKDSVNTKIITQSAGYEIDTLLQQLFPGVNAANITMIPLTSDDYDTLYISGVSSINALINAKRAGVSIGTANADGSGNVAVTQWITDNIPVSGIDLVLEYSAANADAENDTVHVNKGDTIPTIILNNHYNNIVTGDDGASVAITDINGNPLTSGLTGENLQFKVRENEKEIIRAVNKLHHDEARDTVLVVPGLTEKTIDLIGNYLLRDNGTSGTGIEYRKMDGSTFGNSTTGQDFTFKNVADSVQLVRLLTKNNYESVQDTAWFKPGDNISATILNGIYDQLINSATGTGANVTITDIDGNPLTSGLTGETLRFTTPTDQIEIIRAINKEHYNEYKDTVIVVPGLTEKTISLIANYDVTTTVRNKDGTTNVQILDQYGASLSSGIADETQNIKQAADSIHNAKIRITATDAQMKEIIQTLQPGATNISTVIDWIYNNTIKDAKEGAHVTGTFNGKTVFDYTATDQDELKTFLDTLKTSNLNVTQTKTNYVNTDQDVSVSKGSNDVNLEAMLGQYTTRLTDVLSGSTVTWTSTPIGDTLLRGTDLVELYQELPVDSTSVKAILELAGYKNDTIPFINAKPGVTEKAANQEALPNQYVLDLIITEASGDTILTGKTINVREPDGDLQHKVISGQHTQIDIEGNYDGSQNVKIWLNEDTEYDGLTGTVNQSLKSPLVSTWNDTLSIAIDSILAAQTYVAFMDKPTKTDLDIISIAEEGGNSEYNYLNAQGEREQNIYLMLNTEQGTPTPNDIKQFYNEAVEMHANKLITDQGLEIMKMNYDSITSYSSLPNGTFLLLTDDTAPAPGNVKIGNLPTSFNRGYTLLRTWDNSNHNLAILEFGGLIPLKDKSSTGGNSNYYIFSGPVIQDVKVKPLRIALMYKGLTIPDPTP